MSADPSFRRAQREVDGSPASHTDSSTIETPQSMTEGSTERGQSEEVTQEPVKRRGQSKERMAELRQIGLATRRARKIEREADASAAHLTYRQRLGVALSKLSQTQLDAHVLALSNLAATGDAKSIHALARMSDQAFGRAQTAAEPDGRDIDEKAWDELNPEEKAELKAALILELRRSEAAGDAQAQPLGDDSDPRGSENVPT
jgi:hypothetical protein